MINQNDVIAFFDSHAASWDSEMIRSDEIIGLILDNAEVTAGKNVLDVACGTGVLFPDYLARSVSSVTAVDISPEMVKIAGEKAAGLSKNTGTAFSVICSDVEQLPAELSFDTVMVYNAFPHFPDPAALIKSLASHLHTGGILSIAHGMSRAKIDSHHHGPASHVSNGLISETELAGLMEPLFEITTMLSDDRMYQVCGKKR